MVTLGPLPSVLIMTVSLFFSVLINRIRYSSKHVFFFCSKHVLSHHCSLLPIADFRNPWPVAIFGIFEVFGSRLILVVADFSKLHAIKFGDE